MRLTRIGRPPEEAVWHVLAVADSQGRTVRDELLRADPADPDAQAMLAILERHISDHGPDTRNKNKCKPLGKDIFEFRRGAIRVLWFYAPRVRRLIICTHRFYKQSQKTPKREIERAVEYRARYLVAESSGALLLPGDEPR